jgi:two-component system, NarL family, nitrate/nitrite response regulator NarL
MITVILADDHISFRNSLRFLLEIQGDIQVVAIASNGKEAIEQARLFCPEMIVMDISMPLLNGIEAAREICEQCPNTRILMLSIHDSALHVQNSLQAGASGYVLKDSVGQELIPAIRALSKGDHYFSKEIAHPLKGFNWKSKGNPDHSKT